MEELDLGVFDFPPASLRGGAGSAAAAAAAAGAGAGAGASLSSGVVGAVPSGGVDVNAAVVISALTPEEFGRAVVFLPIVKAGVGRMVWAVDPSDVALHDLAFGRLVKAVATSAPAAGVQACEAKARAALDAVLSRPLHDDVHYSAVTGCVVVFVKKPVLGRIGQADLSDRVLRHAVDQAIRTGGEVNKQTLAYFQGGSQAQGGRRDA